ncbi:MAG: helix-turn-helix transcriptional regulator [Patescibacteria group bacterium]|jgi:transcriptional regulator with XRE-family HTH domain|nr:helix-turn-helix transcriptional regulator [Patescibacteria group bacterium]
MTNINISQALARNIKKIRKDKGLSQDKLSKLAGVTLYTITKIEIGATRNPRIETVKRIADALEISIDELLN